VRFVQEKECARERVCKREQDSMYKKATSLAEKLKHNIDPLVTVS
jgi:hypothetical protein